MVSLLLLIVVSAIAWHAYRTLENVLIRQAESHAANVAVELERLLSSGIRSSIRQVGEAAQLPILRSAAPGSPAAREALEARLQSQSAVGIGIRSRDGSWETWVDGPAATLLSDPDRIAYVDDPPAGVAAGPLAASGTTLYYDALAPLPSDPEGDGGRRWLVLRNRVASGETARILEGLVDENAVLLVGSDAPGGTWSNLERPEDRPAMRSDSSFTWDDGHFRGALFELEVAPWTVWIGLPSSRVLAPARALARDVALFGSLALLLGTLGAWFLGRHLSRPIGRLTRAAEVISTGAYEERVPVHGKDEIASLARAFNVMAGKIAAANAHLEERVERRTSQLKETLRDLREAQEQLVRREKLAILGQLASGVGHELRNPLGVMTNAVYYLEALTPEPRPEVSEYFGILRTQLGLAEKIIGDLLDFARRRPPERAAVPLDELAEEQLQRLAAVDSIEVERQYAEGLPPAFVDRVQIGQVVFNLLMNAAQSMTNGGGSIALRTACGENGTLVLCVRDSGEGIEPADLERVFEPLFTTKARGIGLGLSVSKGLVENNEGTIEIESEVGAGTTVTITLPAA